MTVNTDMVRRSGVRTAVEPDTQVLSLKVKNKDAVILNGPMEVITKVNLSMDSSKVKESITLLMLIKFMRASSD